MADIQRSQDTQLEAVDHGTNPTAGAVGANVSWHANRAGVPFVVGGHPNVITREMTILTTDPAQTDAALVTVSAGTKIVVTRASVTVTTTQQTPVACRIGFGTATLPAASLTGVDGIVLAHDGISNGSGVVEGSGAGILGIGADDEDLRVTCDSPSGSGNAIKIIVSYYTIES